MYYGGEGCTGRRAIASGDPGPAESENQGMYASSMHGNREIRGSVDRHPAVGPVGAGEGRTPDVYDPRKSDGDVVSMKRTNKGAHPAQTGQPPAEFVEKRSPAKGNSVQSTVTDTQRSEAASSGLDRVREAAKRAGFRGQFIYLGQVRNKGDMYSIRVPFILRYGTSRGRSTPLPTEQVAGRVRMVLTCARVQMHHRNNPAPRRCDG